MSNIVQNIGFTVGLLTAPALAYADGVQSGNWVPAGSAATSTEHKSGLSSAPVKSISQKKATALSSNSDCDPCADLKTLQSRVKALESRQPGEHYDSVRAEVDRLYEVVNTMADALNGTKRNPDSGLADQVNNLITVYQTLVTRFEKYETSRQEMEKMSHDPALEYMLPIFRKGLAELGESKKQMTQTCLEYSQAYHAHLQVENTLSSERQRVQDKKAQLKLDLENIAKNPALYSQAERDAKAAPLRQEVRTQESTLAAQEEQAQQLTYRRNTLGSACEEAQQDHKELETEFPQRVQKNIFEKRNGSGNIGMEAGVQYGRAEMGSSPVHRMSVQAAVCYQGNKVTFCAGAGVGKAGESTTVSDLSTPEVREQNGEYTQASSQTGTQTNGQQYQWDASMRIAPADIRVARSRWTLTPSALARVEFSRDRVTRDLSRTTQLYAGERPVGTSVSAHGDETEYSNGVIFVPGVAGDLCKNVWSKSSGKSLCARGSVGYDTHNEMPTFAAGVLGKF